MKIKRILAKRICLIAGTVLSVVIGGQLSAQTMIAKKAKVYAVADAHLDTQWNWDIQTTIKEYIWNTLNQNLFLLNRYPNYIFNFEGGVKYAWMKEYYPREYELMKAFVKAGRWHVSGASWDATDTLVPSTESFIRNIMLGQEFYRKELGIESSDIFLPDCFGFGWTLPTVASHCGLIGFSSQKLDWRMNPFYGESKHPYEGALAHRIDFINEIDWQSANSLLKAEFPFNLDNEKATYDLGVGSVQRGNNTPTAYEVYAQYWADLTDSNGSYGVSVMNDSKYGWDKPDNNTLRLTLLHTPKTKEHYAYQNCQDFGYHTFTYSLIGHAGALDVVQIREEAESLNQRIKAFATEKHSGELGRKYSLAFSDNRNVLIKALKKAESSDEYVVRVYETGGKLAQEASIVFADNIVAAVEADGTEKTINKADFSGNCLKVFINPNSIKTYKVRFASERKAQMVTKPLLLTYDKKCFSWNEFKTAADFESGYSYAAELIPAEIDVHGIPFKLEIHEEFNGMVCKGNILKLPTDHDYNRLYILAAAAEKDVQGVFRVGKSEQEVVVPSYTGFIGQWGHTGHTEGYLKDSEVAYVGTHRHSSGGDHPYEFTYMFKLAIDLPAKVTEVVLPDNKDIVIFAATLVNDDTFPIYPATELFRTANKNKTRPMRIFARKVD